MWKKFYIILSPGGENADFDSAQTKSLTSDCFTHSCFINCLPPKKS